MDLYEALKDGTSTSELLGTFYKELDAAAKRIEKEKAEEEAAKKEAELKAQKLKETKEKAKKEATNKARQDVIFAIAKYAAIVLDKPLVEKDVNWLDSEFQKLENTMKKLQDLKKELNEIPTNTDSIPIGKWISKTVTPDKSFTVSGTFDTDDAVIKKFINSLK